jgi:hypothetical protein
MTNKANMNLNSEVVHEQEAEAEEEGKYWFVVLYNVAPIDFDTLHYS